MMDCYIVNFEISKEKLPRTLEAESSRNSNGFIGCKFMICIIKIKHNIQHLEEPVPSRTKNLYLVETDGQAVA